jgi:hypothetical protein
MARKNAIASDGCDLAFRLGVTMTTNGNSGIALPISKSVGNPFASSSPLSVAEKGAAWMIPFCNALTRIGLLFVNITL